MFALPPRQRPLSVRAAVRARGGHRATGAARSQARQAGEGAGARHRMNEVAPLIAAMLSIPLGNRYPPLTLSPRSSAGRQLSALLDQIRRAGRKPVLFLFEDAQWADATWAGARSRDRARAAAARAVPDHLPAGIRSTWKGLPDVGAIALQQLDPAEAETSSSASGGWAQAALGSARADRRHGRRRAAVRGGADQERAGIRASWWRTANASASTDLCRRSAIPSTLRGQPDGPASIASRR